MNIERLERMPPRQLVPHVHTHFAVLLIKGERGGRARLVFVAPGEQIDDALPRWRGWAVLFRGEAIDDNGSQFGFFLARKGDPRWLAYLRTGPMSSAQVDVPAA